MIYAIINSNMQHTYHEEKVEKPTLSKMKNSFAENYYKIRTYINDTGCELLSSVDEYRGRRTSLSIRCINCKQEYKQIFEYFARKTNHICQQCEKKRTSIKSSNDITYVRGKLKENGIILLTTIYEGTLVPIKVKCERCDYNFKQPFQSLIARNVKYCHKCGRIDKYLKRRKIKIAEIKHEIESTTDNKVLEVIDNGVNVKLKLKLECLCGNIYTIGYYYIKHCRKNKCCSKCLKVGKSMFEKEVSEFIESLAIDIIRNDRSIISPKELDIYIPSHKLAIECNGIYWHSELNGKDKKYHLNKTNLCNEQEVQLIHIFDTEWNEKREIIKSIIHSKLGLNERIYARKCEVIRLKFKDIQIFLQKNHIQGAGIPSTDNYGLFYEDELVSVMTFSKSRYNKQYDWELIRFCNKLNVSVVGGASRLYKTFMRNTLGSIITYADKRYSNGNLYEQLGFKHLHDSSPNYFYFNDSINLYSRVNFQKHKLKDKLEIFNQGLTEWENMKNNGYDRIWDAGNKVYEIKIN